MFNMLIVLILSAMLVLIDVGICYKKCLEYVTVAEYIMTQALYDLLGL